MKFSKIKYVAHELKHNVSTFDILIFILLVKLEKMIGIVFLLPKFSFVLSSPHPCMIFVMNE